MSNSILCESINAKLDAFHDSELAEAERTEVVSHIGTCAACAKRLADIDAVKSSLQSLPLLTPKVDVAANFEQILAQHTSKQKVVRLPVIWGGIAVAAAAAVAIFVGHGLISPNPTVIGVTPHSVNSTIASQPKDMAGNVLADRVLDHGPKAATVNKNEKSSGSEQTELANAATAKKDKPNESSKSKLEVQEVAHDAGLEQSNRDRSHIDANKSAQEQNLIASNQNSAKTGSGRGSMDGAGADEIASNPSQQDLGAGAIEPFNSAAVHVGSKGGRNLVAVYDAEQNNASEELGIATDEDGLYAIKL